MRPVHKNTRRSWTGHSSEGSAAETRAGIARSKYNNGLMSFEDWDRIETDLIQRQKAALLGRRERVLAEAAWEQTQGRGAIP